MLVWCIWTPHTRWNNPPSLCVNVWATTRTSTISTGNVYSIEYAKARFPSRTRQKIRHIKRRGKRDTKRGESPTARRRVRAVRVRTSVSRQRRNQTHTSTISRATTTHGKRQGRRTQTRPIVQKTYGRTAWENFPVKFLWFSCEPRNLFEPLNGVSFDWSNW